jgi:serine/threonine protein kinase
MTAEHDFDPGEEVSGFRIVSAIGHGAFGAIYFAQIIEGGRPCALKVEATRQRKRALKYERDIFSFLQGCQYVPRVLRYTRTRRYVFLAMECLGPSVSSVRKRRPGRRLSLSTTLRVGIEVVRGLRELHSRGVLHRDLKPSNLVVRASRRRRIAIIDFGLSRPFIDPATNEPFPRRPHPGFVGTNTYASVSALRGRELGPRDDPISLVFSLVELRTGRLPWKPAGKNRPVALAMHPRTSQQRLFAHCPRQFAALYQIVTHYRLFDVPDYDLFISFLAQAMHEHACSWADDYDWEVMSKRDIRKLTPLDMTVPDDEREPNVPENLPDPIVPNLGDAPELEEVEDDDLKPEEPACGGCCLPFCGR